MNVRHIGKWCLIGTLLLLVSGFGLHKFLAAQPAPARAEQGVEVLTRGPVHEAFAETVIFDPEPGVVVSKTPPAAIEEVPPEQRPEGANVAWIPGYWGWDDERNDYVWISGIWRDLPPDRQWVPGYWGKSSNGYQWTSGYWADAKATVVQYLPEPPATVESGPSAPASSPDQTWLPGCWIWQQDRYAWRPGFWANAQQDWVWIPAHYVWAPRGYVYVDGYWDYAVDRRGVLFAPVYLGADVYSQPGFSYSPTTVIDLGVFADSLFLRPRYQHYYFGDYYAPNYETAGFLPWFSFQANHFGYDPIYSHERWEHRQDRGWEQRQQADFQNRRLHEDLRPPRTWTAQRALGTGQGGGRMPVVARPLDEFRQNKNGPLRFQPVDQAERKQFSQHAQEVQRFREQRQTLETRAVRAPAERRTGEFVPGNAKLPGSPIVGRRGDAPGKDRVVPKAYDAPKPDTRIEPKPRPTRSQQPPQTQRQPPQTQRQPQAQQPQPKAAERQAPQPQGKAPTGPPQGQSKPDNAKDKGKK